MRLLRLTSLFALIGALMCSSLLFASTRATLTLKDGSTLQGSYAGGDVSTVRLEIAGDVRKIPVTDILSIVFTGVDVQPIRAERSNNPADGPTLPKNTPLTVQLAQPVSTAITSTGSPFMAVVAESVELDGEVVIRKGTTIQGRVIESERGGRPDRDVRLELDLTTIKLPGQAIEIVTAPWAYTKMGREGGTGKEAESYVTQAGQIAIPAGAQLEFRLARPVVIPADDK